MGNSLNYYVNYYPNGIKRREYWCKNYQKHREDGPAEIHYNPVGRKSMEEWFKNGQRHRENGPAMIHYNPDGSKSYEFWLNNDRLHRDDGPAEIHYNPDGSKSYESWYRNGNLYDVNQAPLLEIRHEVKIKVQALPAHEVKIKVQALPAQEVKIECRACLSANATILMLDCNHLVYCEDCSKKAGLKCPVCRRDNSNRVKIYY
jgi:hypothetical protein